MKKINLKNKFKLNHKIQINLNKKKKIIEKNIF
jgi:hypothetical protein